MAAIAGIMGGALGFISGLTALTLFNASWLLALGLWSIGGGVIAILMIAMSLLPRRESEVLTGHEHA